MEKFSKDELAERRKADLLQFKMDFLSVVKSPAGFNVLKVIFEKCGVFRTSVWGDGIENAAIRDGQKVIGLFILEMFGDDHEQFSEFLKKVRDDG